MLAQESHCWKCRKDTVQNETQEPGRMRCIECGEDPYGDPARLALNPLKYDPALLDNQRQAGRIVELERKLLLARKGLFWIQVRAACDEGDPCADKIGAVARDHLEETKDPRLPE